MSLLNAIQFVPTTQKGNKAVTYQGVDDTTNAAQFALIKAGKAGTDGILNGVTAREGDYGVVQYFDAAGNAILRRDPKNKYAVSSIGLIDHFGDPGGFKQAFVEDFLGAPADDAVGAVHAAITMPAAASANGIHAAYTLATQLPTTVTTGITNPAGLVPTIAGNDTDMLGPVVLNYTDLAGTAGLTLTLQLAGTTTVAPTLDMIPYGVDTIQSITFPGYTVDASETVVVGTKGLVTIAGFTQPDVPRVLSATGSASGITGNEVLLCTDYEGTRFLATIALSGASTVNGTQAIKTIISALTPPKTNVSGDTVSIDTTDILGLHHRMSTDAVFYTNFADVREATRPTVKFDATNINGNTVVLNSDLDGASGVKVGYIRCDAPLEFDRF